MTTVNPAPWHVDPVDPEDDRKLSEVMEGWSSATGEKATKTGTIRRAVRTLWEKECNQ